MEKTKYSIQFTRLEATALVELIDNWRNSLIGCMSINRYQVKPSEYLSLIPLERLQNRLQSKAFATRHGIAKPFKVSVRFDEIVAANEYIVKRSRPGLASNVLMSINQAAANIY